MSKYSLVLIFAVVIVTISAINAEKQSHRENRMKDPSESFEIDDFNTIDHGKTNEKQGSERNHHGDSIHPKKLSPKKKNKHDEEYFRQLQKEGLGKKGSLLGHRGEHVRDHEKKHKQRFDSREDLHLQDLSYTGPLQGERKDVVDNLDHKKKVNKEKSDHQKQFKKEKKFKKEKETKKDKEWKKKEKYNKKSLHKNKSQEP